ncbi:hypothetical protein NX722_28605 [Endozoicomonas gorgoniicola]|uniref:Phage protein n=1 Tax=Endozoicomonas gorgoniicola TaxID=1234144 RepID=A0ABT3N499_9GAMM|nr:hypothetical protein [Endozoicomonas gorgoniicola]MCW7556450.1 hypothetical protein [Endozoicomonas gorgoniicola]MCW7556529.1 hypothetical protein [Endozoicomonas gorgoniicola]
MEIRTLPAIQNINGELEPIRVGKWYTASYGYEVVTGYCVDVLPTGCILKFRWGDIFRSRYYIDYSLIKGECNDPRVIAKALRLIGAR